MTIDNKPDNQPSSNDKKNDHLCHSAGSRNPKTKPTRPPKK